MMPNVTKTGLALALCLATATPALAHKVVANAYAVGDHIEGQIGFSDGSFAKGAAVDVATADGTKLGVVTTAEDGSFSFTPTQCAVHVFHANLSGGHVANVRLDIADLPVTFAGCAAGGTPATAPVAAEADGASAPVAVSGGLSPEAQVAVAQAVSSAIKPLIREVSELKEKNDLQSILGGLGYIFGLFGLWFFVSARRKPKTTG